MTRHHHYHHYSAGESIVILAGVVVLAGMFFFPTVAGIILASIFLVIGIIVYKDKNQWSWGVTISLCVSFALFAMAIAKPDYLSAAAWVLFWLFD